MKFDYDILFEFLPEKDKKSFMVWDNPFLNVSRDSIVAIYKVLNQNFHFQVCIEESLFIPLYEYELRLKQKERNKKLDSLI
jgi:hypothetical protein